MRNLLIIAAILLSGCNLNKPVEHGRYLDHPCDRAVLSNAERIMYQCKYNEVKAIH